MASTPESSPSPALFFRTVNAYQETEALRTAIHLNLFTAIDEGNRHAASIAARCQASARGVRILCDYLTIIGFLTKENGAWGLTADSARFLSRKSPSYIGSAIDFLDAPMLMEPFMHLTQAVRQGGTVLPPGGTMAPDHPVWLDFARGMASMAEMSAHVIAKLLQVESVQPCKVLDVAAGHGMFGITIAAKNPNAQIYAVDWHGVLDIARQHAQKAGVESRWHALPGSAFDIDLGSGYDLVLLTNFLHHFDPAANETLLRRMHQSLKPGGKAVTLDFVPNDDRITPPGQAGFALIMLGTTDAGDAYTFAEYDRMFRAAGFTSNQLHDMPGGFSRVLISTK